MLSTQGIYPRPPLTGNQYYLHSQEISTPSTYGKTPRPLLTGRSVCLPLQRDLYALHSKGSIPPIHEMLLHAFLMEDLYVLRTWEKTSLKYRRSLHFPYTGGLNTFPLMKDLYGLHSREISTSSLQSREIFKPATQWDHLPFTHKRSL